MRSVNSCPIVHGGNKEEIAYSPESLTVNIWRSVWKIYGASWRRDVHSDSIPISRRRHRLNNMRAYNILRANWFSDEIFPDLFMRNWKWRRIFIRLRESLFGARAIKLTQTGILWPENPPILSKLSLIDKHADLRCEMVSNFGVVEFTRLSKASHVGILDPLRDSEKNIHHSSIRTVAAVGSMFKNWVCSSQFSR